MKNLESDMFDLIYEIHINLKNKRKDSYKLCLAALDELNKDYKQLTGKYYINNERIVDYYAKLWDNF